MYTGPGCLSGYGTVAIMLVPDHPSVPAGFDYPVPVFTSTALVETCISISFMLVCTDHWLVLNVSSGVYRSWRSWDPMP